jgi:hypothetical protein
VFSDDALRIQMNTFYHLPYLIGAALGIQGGYVPFQVVYAVLWWARGFLVFLILRKVLPRPLSICYAAGALVVIHASDGALGWVGQMNQFGFIFWMVLAFYLLALGAESANWALPALFVIAAGLGEYMSLWSYESQLLLLLVLPLGLLFRWRSWRKLAFMRLTRENRRPNPFVESIWTWWTLLAVGFILVVLSFPVYLLLDSARGLWRTQFLSGIGAGLVRAALSGLISHAFVRHAAKIALFLAFRAVIAFFGSASAIQKGALHRWIWERHRVAIKEILQVAPSVQPYTIIVLANVPKHNDPFGDEMWLDMALRLVYPGIPVAGVYCYADGTPGPSDGWKAGGKSWTWGGTGFPPVFPGTGLPTRWLSITSRRAEEESRRRCRLSCARRLARPNYTIRIPL